MVMGNESAKSNKVALDFENCATHIHDDDRTVTPRT